MDARTAALRDEVAQLMKSRGDIDKQIQRRQLSLLKALPESMGYETMDALILALTPLASTALRAGANTHASTEAPRGRRPKQYDGQVRARVRHAIETLGTAAASVSRSEGISLPTIMKWKREWGLTVPALPSNGNGSPILPSKVLVPAQAEGHPPIPATPKTMNWMTPARSR